MQNKTHGAERRGESVRRIHDLPLQSLVDRAHEQLQVGRVKVLWQVVFTGDKCHICQSGLRRKAMVQRRLLEFVMPLTISSLFG